MKTITKYAIPAVLLLSLATGLAYAQQNNPPSPEDQMTDAGPDGGHKKHRGHHGKSGMRGLMMLDINNDGFINADEAAALAETMFMHIDRNHDGAIDLTEATTPPGHGWRKWMGGNPPQEMIDKLKAAFAERDADKDGKVTKLEFMKFAEAKYAALDIGKDGKVSPWAFRAQPKL